MTSLEVQPVHVRHGDERGVAVRVGGEGVRVGVEEPATGHVRPLTLVLHDEHVADKLVAAEAAGLGPGLDDGDQVGGHAAALLRVVADVLQATLQHVLQDGLHAGGRELAVRVRLQLVGVLVLDWRREGLSLPLGQSLPRARGGHQPEDGQRRPVGGAHLGCRLADDAGGASAGRFARHLKQRDAAVVVGVVVVVADVVDVIVVVVVFVCFLFCFVCCCCCFLCCCCFCFVLFLFLLATLNADNIIYLRVHCVCYVCSAL